MLHHVQYVVKMNKVGSLDLCSFHQQFPCKFLDTKIPVILLNIIVNFPFLSHIWPLLSSCSFLLSPCLSVRHRKRFSSFLLQLWPHSHCFWSPEHGFFIRSHHLPISYSQQVLQLAPPCVDGSNFCWDCRPIFWNPCSIFWTWPIHCSNFSF